MFDNNIKTEPIPERVFELCQMVSKEDLNDKLAKERMEPTEINPSSSTYYSSIRDVCVKELQLISKENDILKFIGDKKILKDMNSFRKYCNSIVFNNTDTYFYKIANCYLESNDEWLKYKTLTDVNIRREIQDKSKILLVNEQMILGMRFWISFLGFGYIQEGNAMYYLPNMYVALQDFCELSNLEKNKEYSVKEFLDEIYSFASVALKETRDSKTFNLAMSIALRQMHDKNEITIKKNLDSKETWNLFKDETHEFTEKFTHIIYRGVKRR